MQRGFARACSASSMQAHLTRDALLAVKQPQRWPATRAKAVHSCYRVPEFQISNHPHSLPMYSRPAESLQLLL